MPEKKDNRSDLARKNKKSYLMTQGRVADETFEYGTRLIKLFTSVSAQPISFFLSPPHFQVSEDAPESLFFSSKCYISYEATKRWIIHFFLPIWSFMSSDNTDV